MCKSCNKKKCNCPEPNIKGLVKALADIRLEVAKLKLRLDKCCGAVVENPAILNFQLNVGDVVGDQNITLNSASFTLVNGQNVEPDSLKIYDLNTNTEIASGLSVISPSSFGPITKAVVVGGTYSWRASVVGTDGETYFSDDYTIEVTETPVVVNRLMYTGTTDMAPQEFQALTVAQIFALPGELERTITGLSNRTFTMTQDKTIHYLLIPDDEMTLINAEFGDVLITTLWNNTSQTGAYFPRDGGVTKGDYLGKTYRLFFFYTPTVFSDAIRITVKNKS